MWTYLNNGIGIRVLVRVHCICSQIHEPYFFIFITNEIYSRIASTTDIILEMYAKIICQMRGEGRYALERLALGWIIFVVCRCACSAALSNKREKKVYIFVGKVGGFLKPHTPTHSQMSKALGCFIYQKNTSSFIT